MEGDATGSGDGAVKEPPTFQIVSPNYDVRPGADVMFCFYFQTSNTSDLAIRRWVSRMSPGVLQTIVNVTPENRQPPGTFSSSSCGIEATGASQPTWIYSARTPDAEAVMPSDDGAGHPVGYVIRAGQSGFLQMHYVNDTNTTLHAHVEIDAYAYRDGVQVTPAGTFFAYNRMMVLPPRQAAPSAASVKGTCNVPSDNGQTPKFFAMTTQTFKQGVHTAVKDGDTTAFESTSWSQPGSASWSPPKFYVFSTGKLTYQCDYVNQTGGTIRIGDDPATSETCMAVGYYFPLANENNGHFCLNDTTL